MAIRKMMSEADQKKFEEEIIKKYKAEHSGVKTFIVLMLYGIVWLTLVTSIASLFIKTK